MFSGVTAGLGRVLEIKKQKKIARLTLEAPSALLKDLKYGASVCVSGVCLSVVAHRGKRLSFDMVAETLKRSCLGRLKAHDRVNLERPLRYGSRIEGHIVQGHVDGTGQIVAVQKTARQRNIQISCPRSLGRYLIEKGSIAVDGVSLTIGKVHRNRFWVHCIPVTLRKTTLGLCREGDWVNLEADWLLKACAKAGYRRVRLNRLK